MMILLLCVLAAVTATAPDSLKLVNVVYRHGDRSPIAIYPTDPYKDKWPQGPGWLTTLGMQQQYALGQFLRSEYGSLLSPSYNNTEIVVASSNVDRCLMSAYCNLAGLYPPQGDQVWNSSLLWQPIPVHTRPQDQDHVLAIEENCPRYNDLYSKELRSPLVKEEERSNRVLYQYVETFTGVRTENITNVWEVADALFCETTHNYPLPQWARAQWEDTTVYEKLQGIGDFSFNLLFNGTELSRLKGGPLLKVFIQNMQKATQQEPHYKMYMYSAHDSTVAAVSDALRVFNNLTPPYATALLVELHEMETIGHCVKIRYRNESDAAPFTLINPDCQVECCPLEHFVEVTKGQVPVDWKAECGKKRVIVVTNQVIAGALIVVSSLLILLFTIVCLVAVKVRQRRRGRRPLVMDSNPCKKTYALL